jgi:hypothetical protein
MTPKEKAEELIRKYYRWGLHKDGQSLSWLESKECALICVDEMMSIYASALHAIGIEKHIAEITQSAYLQQLKQEIEKL